MAKEVVTIQLSTWTIVKVVGVLLILGLLFLISDVLAVVFVALVLASALEPLIAWFNKRWGLHRAFATAIIYVLILAVLFSVVVALVPPLTKQVSEISSQFPTYYHRIIKSVVSFTGNQVSQQTAQQLLPATSAADDSTGSLAATLFSIFGGVVGFVLVWVIAFYFIVDEKGLKQFITSLSPVKYQDYYLDLLNRIRLRTGYWLRGQLLTSIVVGVLYYAGLKALGVPYALLLAVGAGLLEVVPFLGPIVAALPAVFFGLMKSGWIALAVIILYIIVQQLEGRVISPRVLSERSRLNPLLSILVILIGLKVAGILGAILAVPIATALAVIISDLVSKKIPQDN